MPNTRTITIEVPDFTTAAASAAERIESARAMNAEQTARKVSVVNNAKDILCTYLLETFAPLYKFPLHDSEKHVLPAGCVELERRNENDVTLRCGLDNPYSPLRPVYNGNTLVRGGQTALYAEIHLSVREVQLWFCTYEHKSMRLADGLAYLSHQHDVWSAVKDSINLWIEQVMQNNAEAYEAEARAAQDSADTMTNLLADFTI